MLFEKEYINAQIIGVVRLKQGEISIFNTGRDFNALSFRMHSDAVLYSNGQEYKMKDGSVGFVPANVDYKRIATFDEMTVVHFITDGDVSKSIEAFEISDFRYLKMLFDKIWDCFEKKESGYKYKCASVFYEILAECHRQNGLDEAYVSKIKNSVEFIKGNFTDPDLKLEAVAKCSFVSEVYFRKLFKEEYGISPLKYIINLRIQRAMQLISEGYYTLKEVAYMSGYNDYRHFSTEFKKINGVSPSEFMHSGKKGLIFDMRDAIIT